MIKTYTYRITGTAANAQTWETSGKVSCELHKVFDQAMLDTFGQLTQGRAVYGQPGVGCDGPYDVTRITIEQVRQ